MKAECLTSDELYNVTGKQRPHAQLKELNHMGITYTKRLDGSPVVDRAHYERIMGVTPKTKEPKIKEPDWNALNG